ncbi:MAG: SRPBCC family protein [Acidimicrobiales bacterium]
MRLDFDEHLPVPPEAVFDYFRSPADWPRLYGAFGEVRDLGHGWVAVPLAGEYPDLEARLTSLELDRHAAWDLRGTFAGRGRVDLTPDGEGTRVTGFEEVDVAGLDDPETEERIRSGFAAIWQSGWDRLRDAAAPQA